MLWLDWSLMDICIIKIGVAGIWTTILPRLCKCIIPQGHGALLFTWISIFQHTWLACWVVLIVCTVYLAQKVFKDFKNLKVETHFRTLSFRPDKLWCPCEAPNVCKSLFTSNFAKIGYHLHFSSGWIILKFFILFFIFKMSDTFFIRF